MRKYWLVTTEHLEDALWFRDEEDFKVGMNFVAIQAHCSLGRVRIVAFILMSNHVHFVLEGSWKDVSDFINAFKHRYSMYYRRKYGVKEFLRRNNVDIKPIYPEDEAFERAIAYVQMNCVAANICAHPSQYPWGTGSTFFDSSEQSGSPLGSLSKRARKRMLHSDREDLPDNWIMGDSGYILPQYYVNSKTVEALYITPSRMNYFLQKSSKAKKRVETAEKNLPAFRDQIILSALPDLCKSLFGKGSYHQLSADQQVELIRQIRFRFSANVNQIARVCGVSYEVAAQKMDSQ